MQIDRAVSRLEVRSYQVAISLEFMRRRKLVGVTVVAVLVVLMGGCGGSEGPKLATPKSRLSVSEWVDAVCRDSSFSSAVEAQGKAQGDEENGSSMETQIAVIEASVAYMDALASVAADLGAPLVDEGAVYVQLLIDNRLIFAEVGEKAVRRARSGDQDALSGYYSELNSQMSKNKGAGAPIIESTFDSTPVCNYSR